jgi:hypothetical protein
MVDYPQEHYIEVTISLADLTRQYSNDYVFARDRLVTIALSEVQWARMISSLNTEGVPCTMVNYYKPTPENFVRPTMPDEHVGKAHTFKKEIQKTAGEAASKVDEAMALLDAMLSEGTMKKADAKVVREKLRSARQDLASNLPFVVEQAEEAIEKSIESGKAEISAHIDFALLKLGERALGDKMADALVSPDEKKALGREVIAALTNQTKE